MEMSSFQTGKGLPGYLLKHVQLVYPGIHFNVALPLYQPVTGCEGEPEETYKAFLGLYYSNNLSIYCCYQCLRQIPLNLNNSPDPVLREYYI